MSGKIRLNAFWLKIIAIVAMTCNHIAHVFGGRLPDFVFLPLYAVGGFTFPIMAFLMVEGYHKTRSLQKYMLRLFVFGVLAFFPFIWALYKAGNVLFTLLLGLVCLYAFDHFKNRLMFMLCFLAAVLASTFCDWQFFGVTLMLAYGVTYKIGKGKIKGYLISTAVMAVIGVIMVAYPALITGGFALMTLADCLYMLACVAATGLMRLYNGERGPHNLAAKYLFYAYYPAHLLFLVFLRDYVFR